jgi:Holliday junction resolvasome RuvABC DNA-binding subunit
MTLEAVDEHLKLNGELNKHGPSTHDIDKLLNFFQTLKKYGFDDKEIAEKLYNIQELELKEKQLKDKCKKLLKRISRP